jgi:hypothetical protein
MHRDSFSIVIFLLVTWLAHELLTCFWEGDCHWTYEAGEEVYRQTNKASKEVVCHQTNEASKEEDYCWTNKTSKEGNQ